jgi:ribosomal-protein-serine acetyltransferase
MNRLYLRCAVGNIRSRKIALALGFSFEGTQRQAEWLYDHFVDLEMYSLLASEWPGFSAFAD